METKILKSINLIRRGSGANLNLFRYTAMVLVLLLGVSDAWGGSTYYSKVTTSQSPTGKGTVYVVAGNTFSGTATSATSSGSSQSQTYSLKATPTAAGYYFVNWTSTGTATLSFNSSTNASTTCSINATSESSSSPTTGKAQANWAEITIGAGVASPASINATNNSTTCTDYTGSITFNTKGDAKDDFYDATPPVANTGHGTFSVTSWEVASNGTVTVNYKFVGDGTYGGASGTRNRSTSGVFTLKSKPGNNSNTCTVTASFPNITIAAGEGTSFNATLNEEKQSTATFAVEYADDADDFTAEFSDETTGSTWGVDDISYADGVVTVTYSFNSTVADTHTATLTLTANDNAGGSSNTAELTAISKAKANDDASVTYNNTTTNYSTIAAAISAANSKPGAVVTLLRNIPSETTPSLSSPLNITGMMTLDLNSYTIARAGMADGSQQVITVNMSNAASVLTIKDSSVGHDGKISGTGGSNGNMLYAVCMEKGVLNFESGIVECTNTNSGDNAKATGIRVKNGCKLLMQGGTINATTSGNPARGIYATTTSSNAQMVVVSGGFINTKAANSSVGIDCESTDTPSSIDPDPTKANAILSGVTVDAQTTGTIEAIAVRSGAGVILGIQNGSYTATSKTTTAYAVQSSGHTAILGGTFNANATTNLAHAMRVEKGITAVKGGTFTATAEEKTAHGAYVCDGAKLLTYGGTFKGVVNAMVVDGWATGTQVYDGGTLEAQGGTFIGEANNLNQASEIAVCAAGIYLNNSSKASYATISNATLQGKINNANLKGADSSTQRGAHGLVTRTTSPVTLTNCTISANSAYTYGFGIRSTNTSIDVKNCSISVTTSKSYNYGIYTYGTAVVNISNSTVECTSQEAECSGAFLTNGTRLDAEKTNFNVTANQSSATAVTAANSRGVNLESGSVANLNGCVIKFKGNANYTKTVYGIRNIGTASIEDCTIKVYSVKEAAYALCGGESSVSTGVGSGKFYVSTGTTDGSTVTTGTNTFSMYGNNSVGKTYLYGGYYTQINNLEKFLPAGYGIETLPSGSTEYGEGYRYAIRPTTAVGDPVCKIGAVGYTTLEEALEFVNKNSGTANTIVMVKDYTLPAGNYTLPANATLLVPYKSDQTSAIGKSPDRVSTYTQPECYRRLILADGVNLIVNGTIEASAQMACTGQGNGKNGYTNGKYGLLQMLEGSKIVLNNGAKLMVWGFIAGERVSSTSYKRGSIEAKRGSKIYQGFQIGDWKGGSAVMFGNLIDNAKSIKAFPINQYFIMNIEVPVLYRPGAEQYGATGVDVSGIRGVDEVPIVGVPKPNDLTHQALFLLEDVDVSEDTWIIEEYDPLTDRWNFTMNSSAKIGSLNVNVSGYAINSKDYVLPLTHCMKLHMLSGDLTITQSTVFLPGVELEIDKEAEVIVNNGQTLYFVDQDSWGKIAGHAGDAYYQVPWYSPAWKTKGTGGAIPTGITQSDCPRYISAVASRPALPDALLNLHGKLTVNGALHTSDGGANIFSSNEDAGTIKFVTAASGNSNLYFFWKLTGSSISTKCVFTSSTDWTKSTVTTSAKLRNGDDTYESTSGTVAGKTWIYTDDKWKCWEADGCFIRDAQNNPYAKPADYVRLTSDEPDANHVYKAYSSDRYFIWDADCQWWEIDPSLIAGGEYKAIKADHNGKYNYYEYSASAGYWIIKKVTVTWMNESTTLDTYSNVGYKTHPRYLSAAPAKSATASEYFTWTGWTVGSAEGEFYDKDAELPAVTGNTTLYAYFETHKFEYTITFRSHDGAVLEAKRWAHGEIPTYDGTPTKTPTAAKEYTFDGWSSTKGGSKVTVAAASAAADYYAHFAESDRKYTIQWVNYDGTVLKEEPVTYNTTPSAPVTPTRPNDDYYTYTYDAWSPAIATVTGDQTYTATYTYEKLVPKYTVTFKNGATTVFSQNLVENTVPVFDGNEPTKEATAQYSYTFDGWSTTNGGDLAYAKDVALPALTADVTYYAHFATTTNSYKVLWKSEDGKQLLETDAAVTYNATPEFNSTTPTKANLGTTIYLFDGWSTTVGGAKLSTLPAVTEDKVFYAHFSVAVASVTAGGNTTYHTTVAEAFTAATGKTNPTIKMLQDVSLGTATLTYDGANECTLDLNGHEISGSGSIRLLVIDNASAIFTVTDLTESKLGKLSLTASTAQNQGPAFCALVENGKLYVEAGTIYLYSASTSTNAVSLRSNPNGEFIMNGGTAHVKVTQSGRVGYGTQSIGKATINGGTVRAEADNGTAYGIYVHNANNATMTVNGGRFYITGANASSSYAINTTSPTGKLLIKGGYYSTNNNLASYVAPGKSEWNYYSFELTTAEKAEVGNDYNYKVAEAYTVTFKDGDNYTIQSGLVEKDQTPAYNGATPTKPADASYSYTHSGWTPEIVSVTDNATYTATFSQTEVKYTVSVAAGANGSASPASVSNIGCETASGDITATPDAGYQFTGWTLPEGVTAANGYTANSNPIRIHATATGKIITANFVAGTANYTVKHWQQNIANDEYSEFESETKQGTTATTTAAAANSYTGFEAQVIEQGTIAGDGSTVVDIYYDRITYTITWKNGDNTIETDQDVKYGATPSYDGATPTQTKTVEWVYTHDSWTPAVNTVTADATYTATFTQEKRKYNVTWTGVGITERTDQVAYGETPDYGELPTQEPTVPEVFTYKWMNTANAEIGVKPVTCDVTYAGSFTGSPRPYTITFVNDDGSELQSSEVTYGSTPTYEGTPTSTKTDGKYNFIGWTPEIVVVSGAATYTAMYEKVILPVVVNQGEAETISVQSSTTTTIVEDGGILTVTENAKLTTDDLVLEATPSTSGEILAPEEQEAIVAHGTVTFKFSQPGGFKARTWYSVAVPWQVAVPHNAPSYTTLCDIYAKKGTGGFTQLRLGSTIDLIYYDGQERADNGHSEDCWKYVEDMGTEEVMYPGKAYMFYLLNAADTLRFVRKSNTPLRTNTTNVEPHGSGNVKNENWNGIANPATYHAYLDARQSEEDVILGYIYNGDTRGYCQVNMNTTKLVVGQAVYIQAPMQKTVVAMHDNSPQAHAPLRAKSTNRTLRYDVHIGSKGTSSDFVIIRMDEQKDGNRYIIGRDVVKFGDSSDKAQLWVNRYDAKLGMNTMAPEDNMATYPLGISVPQTGEYTINIDQSSITDGDMLYLTYDGRIMWNLTYAPYVATLEKGTNTRYGLTMVRNNAPEVATDIDRAVVDSHGETRKVLINEKVFIIRGNKVYSADGRLVK